MKKIAIGLSLGLVAACGQPSVTPLSPASVLSSLTAGPNGETLKASAPTLVSPVGGVEVFDLDPEFFWNNAKPTFASDQNFTYDFEVYDPAGVRVRSFNVPQTPGVSTIELKTDFDYGTQYTWRVRARLGTLTGPWSSTGTFRMFEQFTCAQLGKNPVAIISCHRNQFPGHMSKDQLETVMRGVARDFNRVGIEEDWPWGVLQKHGGNNCNGISCDIICSGDGGFQDQYDILIDEDIPVWGGALPDIRVDACIVQR